MGYENRDDFMWFCLGSGVLFGAAASQFVPLVGLALAGIVMLSLWPLVRRVVSAASGRLQAR